MDADGMRIDELEATARPARARGASAEVRLHRAHVPEPGRRDDVAGAPAAPGRDRPRARAARAGGQPVLAAALRGRRRADACSRSTAASSSCTSARSRRSSRRASAWAGRWRRAPVIEKMNLGKQGVDLCSSSMTQLFVAEYFREGRWLEYVGSLRELYRRRRDAMLDALAEHFPREAEWTYPQGGHVPVGHAARLHRHHRPAGPRAAGERRLRARPGRLPRRPRRLVDAAELLRRRRGRHPRGRAAHRQGRARAGRRCTERSPARRPASRRPSGPSARRRRRARRRPAPAARGASRAGKA